MPRLATARTTIISVLFLAIFSAILPNAARAQGGATGAITGTVLDRSGGLVPNASIQVIDIGTGQVVRLLTGGGNGTFTATLLPPANYRVVVNAPGFAEARATEVAVRVTETTTINFTLQPSSVTEKVEVSAQVVSVNTENATTGQTIEQQVIGGLPLATRNFQQLLTLSSGASSTLNNSEQLGRGTVRINVNGQRGDNNNYLIEGISATDNNVGELTNTPLPSPDVIQEFKVQTSLYDASQGRNGGGMVNAVLRTGTNEWHGDAFEFFRNDVLNANPFFLNRAGLPRPSLKQNIFGGSVGGPLASQGKFGYIFGNYQGARQRSGADLGTLIGTVLPAIPADRSDASLLATFFPGNPNAKIDPVVGKLLNAKGNLFCPGANGFLIPSVPSGNFNCSNPGRFSDNQFTTNWDRKFRDGKEKFAVRFFFSNSDAFKPFGGGGLTSTYGAPPSATDLNFPLDIPVNTRFLSGTWTHIFSAEKVNQFTFGYNRINNSYTNVPPIKRSDLGITSPTDSVTNSIYKFTFNSSGFQIGPSPGDNSQVQNNFTYGDVFSWVRGRHELRFGGEWDRINLHKLFPQIFNDQIFFSNTAAVLSTGTPAFTDFQNFLQGAPQFVFGQSGAFNHDYHHNNISAFAQDDWKATQNLTVNVGLRLEEFGAWYDNACHIGNFDPSLIAQSKYPYIYPKCVNKFNVQGLQGTASSTTLNNSYARGWGPRIGLAYDVFGRHTTTVRAGFGIYYVQQDVGAVDNLSFQSPLLDVVSFGGPGGCLATFFQPGNLQPANCQALNPNPNGLPPAGVISPAFVPALSQVAKFTINGTTTQTTDTSQTPQFNNNGVNLFTLQVPRHFRVPSVQQWNLSIQRALGHDWVLEVGYVGSHSVHLREVHNGLQSFLVSPQKPLTIPSATGGQFVITTNTIANAIVRTRALGVNGYGAFEQFSDDAYGHYNSIQTTLSRRWGAGYIQAAYTFSRSTDATSSYNTAFNTLFNNQLNLNGSRGLSDFDRTHRLAVSYVYNLPFYAKARGWQGKALGGWAFSGVSVFQSGLPFSIIDSSAGSAFDSLTTIPNTTASLKAGATQASGLTSGSIGSRLGGNGQQSYLNASAFVAAPVVSNDAGSGATGFGTLGRNTYRGPFQQNWDVSLIKNLSITERQKIKFTTDFFDVWNHPVFSNPAFTDIQNPAGFGQIISTENNPRILQFSLTWSF